jgi:hypothetical protein
MKASGGIMNQHYREESVKRLKPGQRTLRIDDERERLEKDAATKFLRQADGGKGRHRKRRPQRQSRRQHQIAIDKARFAAEMEIYNQRPKPADKGES